MSPFRTFARPRRLALAAALLFPLALSGCPAAGSKPAPATSEREAGMPAPSVYPMSLNGQRVLMLPVQAAPGVSAGREAVTAELAFALQDRDPAATWITPDELRRALARAPGYAQDPATLPGDAFLHHRERYIVDPLASVVRRYSALVDARVVILPREARFVPEPGGEGGRVRIGAVAVDARTGSLIWWGEADGEARPSADEAAVASAASALAARMLTAGPR